MTIKKSISLILLLFLLESSSCIAGVGSPLPTACVTYDSIPSPANNSLIIAVFNEAIVPSFTNVFNGPFHPGILVAKQHILSIRKKHHWLWNYNLAFYHHRLVQNAFFLSTELGYGRRFHSLDINLLAGLGYMRTYYPGKLYSYANGEYEKTNDTGKGHFMSSFALRSGYTFINKNKNSYNFFIQYLLFIENSFSPKNDIPILPHGAFCIGMTLPVNF